MRIFVLVTVLGIIMIGGGNSHAASFDKTMGGTVTYKKTVLQLKGGEQVIVRIVGPKKGPGVTWREYRTRSGLFLGVGWDGPIAAASPNCTTMLHTFYEMLPGQLPGQKKSRFVTVIDWTKDHLNGKMYLPQLFPKGFHVADLR